MKSLKISNILPHLFAIAICIFLGKLDGSAQKIYSVDHQYQADVKVYVTDSEYQADLKIYFTDHEYRAGWKNNSKKPLLY